MDKNTFNFLNLNEFTWQLNIAVAGLVFSIFALIYNDHYIYYGFFTFLFGLLGHIGYNFLVLVFNGDKSGDKRWTAYYLYLFVLLFFWMYLVRIFYFA